MNASEKQSVWRNIWWDLYRIGWSDWIGLKLNGGGRIYFGPLWHQFSSRAVSHGLDSILLWIMFPPFPGPFIICSLICGLCLCLLILSQRFKIFISKLFWKSFWTVWVQLCLEPFSVCPFFPPLYQPIVEESRGWQISSQNMGRPLATWPLLIP